MFNGTALRVVHVHFYLVLLVGGAIPSQICVAVGEFKCFAIVARNVSMTHKNQDFVASRPHRPDHVLMMD